MAAVSENNKIYPWQIGDADESLDKRSSRLEQRRSEILNSLESVPFEEYDTLLINEWIRLTEERDHVFHQIHHWAMKRDLNKHFLIACEALKNALRISYTLQYECVPPNLHKALVACSRELHDYIVKADLEPLQIVITQDVYELPNLNTDDEAEGNSSGLRPDVEIPIPDLVSSDDVTTTDAQADYESYLHKVIDWKVSPLHSDADSSQQSIFETQSNATYESCFDSVLVSSMKRKPPFNRFSGLTVSNNAPMPIDFHTPYMDKIQDILNTSID